MIMEINNILTAYAEVPSMAIETGYEMKTTYWGDFRVCGYDIDAIKDTYKRAKEFAKDDKIYGTELTMVLNWLCWFYYEKNEKVARLYQDLWADLDGYICDHWKGDDLSYFYQTTD